jgi:hypothetical protein
VYEPEAVAIEETNKRSDREFRMRVRVITQTISDLWHHRAILNPQRSGFYAIELLSHKVLRYLAPALLIAILLSSAALASQSDFYFIVFVLQALFYLLAFIGWMAEGFGIHQRLIALPHYFVLANLAVVLAFIKFLRGERYARWEPIREGGDFALARKGGEG